MKINEKITESSQRAMPLELEIGCQRDNVLEIRSFKQLHTHKDWGVMRNQITVLALMMALFGCDHPTDDAPLREVAAMVQANGNLGAAYHRELGPLENHCVESDRVIVGPSTGISVSAFYSKNSDRIEEQFQSIASTELDVEALALGVRASRARSLLAEEDDTILHILTRITTVTQTFMPVQNTDSRCSPYRASWEEFVADCGHGYVGAQTLGGYVFVSLNVSSLSYEQKAALTANNALGAVGFVNSTFSVLDSLADVGIDQAIVRYDAIRVDLNIDFVDEENQLATIKTVLDGIRRFRIDPEALASQTLNHRSYGSKVITQYVRPYGIYQIAACGVPVPQEAITAYACYKSNQAVVAEYNHLRKRVHSAQAILDNAHDYAWTDETATIKNLSELIQQFDDCEPAVMDNSCEQTMLTEDFGNVCDVCFDRDEFERRGCEPQAILGALENSLDMVVEKGLSCGPTLECYPTTIDTSGSEFYRAYTTQYCTLAGISGQFAGGTFWTWARLMTQRFSTL